MSCAWTAQQCVFTSPGCQSPVGAAFSRLSVVYLGDPMNVAWNSNYTSVDVSLVQQYSASSVLAASTQFKAQSADTTFSWPVGSNTSFTSFAEDGNGPVYYWKVIDHTNQSNMCVSQSFRIQNRTTVQPQGNGNGDGDGDGSTTTSPGTGGDRTSTSTGTSTSAISGGNVGRIVGITVGAVAAFAFLLATVAAVQLLQKRRRQRDLDRNSQARKGKGLSDEDAKQIQRQKAAIRTNSIKSASSTIDEDVEAGNHSDVPQQVPAAAHGQCFACGQNQQPHSRSVPPINTMGIGELSAGYEPVQLGPALAHEAGAGSLAGPSQQIESLSPTLASPNSRLHSPSSSEGYSTLSTQRKTIKRKELTPALAQKKTETNHIGATLL